MVTTNPAAKTNTVVLVSTRLCSGCGKYFLHDHGYTLDPGRKGPDGGPAVFHRRCYTGPETPVIDVAALEKMSWERLESARADDDESLIYCFEKQVPAALAHDARKMSE